MLFIGLTATLVREDNLIADLNHLVGPKIYEANWMDLTQQGYLANVQCIEVWCPMTKEFYEAYMKYSNYVVNTHHPEYQGLVKKYPARGGNSGNKELTKSNARLQQLLYIINPTKFRTAEFLLKYHCARGDKIILFSDDVPALILYCDCLKIPYIFGETPEAERNINLTAFRTHPQFNCIGEYARCYVRI